MMFFRCKPSKNIAPKVTYLSFLHVEIIYDHTDEKIQREERTKDDEKDEI